MDGENSEHEVDEEELQEDIDAALNGGLIAERLDVELALSSVREEPPVDFNLQGVAPVTNGAEESLAKLPLVENDDFELGVHGLDESSADHDEGFVNRKYHN